jgi:acyl-CoA synthetase (AMP-forming)/AMP-acid ligase II
MNLHSASSATGELERLILRQAERAPGRRFLGGVFGTSVVTYGQLAQRVRRCGSQLDAAGVARGSRVLIDLPDPVAFAVACIGVVAAGRCAVPVHPDTSGAELAAVRPEAAIRACPERLGGVGLDVLPVPGEADEGAFGCDARGSLLLPTRGSAGDARRVELTEDRLLHVAVATARHDRLTALDHGFSPLPQRRVDVEMAPVLATLVAGGELMLDDRFHRHGFWETLIAHDVTWANLSPEILAVLAEGMPPSRVPRLRFIRSASAPLPVGVRDRIEEFTGAIIVESYGMVEAAGQIAATPLDGTAPDGSCGRPVAIELVVRGRDGLAVAPGVTGEVWIRGAGVIEAYDGGSAGDRFDADGWLVTGDRGWRDEDGFLFLAGAPACEFAAGAPAASRLHALAS